MNISLAFIRVLFVCMSILFVTSYTTSAANGGYTTYNLLLGLISGSAVGALLMSTDLLFKRFNLRSFNISALGLFFGYLLGQAIVLVFTAALDTNSIAISAQGLTLAKVIIFLFTSYVGMVMTARAAEEIQVSIPFIKFKPTSHKKKDILIDSSILMDSRIIDLASSGLLDHHLILPRFLLKELYQLAESSDESQKSKARRCLEVVKKLEAITTLDMRYSDSDFPEIKDSMAKLIRLARLIDANIITADMSRIQQSAIEGIKVINIHSLSNALKPLTQNGEYINIKIQRYGKEARQGVGYLDDGTMVVVNGGAEFIGETIKTQVLSVKHTSSGRMIFCNAADENGLTEQDLANMENSHKNYFAL